MAPGVEGGLSIATAPGATDKPSPTNTAESTAESATATPSPAAEAAYLAAARGGDDPEALTRAAIAAIGGMGQFVPAGSNVIIKPNICTAFRGYKYAATTNPWVVGALVKMSLESGASRVRVFDSPFNGDFTGAYKNSGIAEQVLAAGGEMEAINWDNYVAVQPPGTKSFRSAKVYGEILNADVLIDVPIAKHHGTTGLTLAMKNLMGVVYDRGAIHNNIHQQIAELANFIRPKLTVIDGVRILLAGGPLGGSLGDVRKMDTVIASADIVAADAYATRLFGWSDPNRLGYVKIGAQLGLGRSDLENLKIQEIAIA
jgi:uncharacterized protein (DUF362 family)